LIQNSGFSISGETCGSKGEAKRTRGVPPQRIVMERIMAKMSIEKIDILRTRIEPKPCTT
jgi:hypothetical protein